MVRCKEGRQKPSAPAPAPVPEHSLGIPAHHIHSHLSQSHLPLSAEFPFLPNTWAPSFIHIPRKSPSFCYTREACFGRLSNVFSTACLSRFVATHPHTPFGRCPSLIITCTTLIDHIDIHTATFVHVMCLGPALQDLIRACINETVNRELQSADPSPRTEGVW